MCDVFPPSTTSSEAGDLPLHRRRRQAGQAWGASRTQVLHDQKWRAGPGDSARGGAKSCQQERGQAGPAECSRGASQAGKSRGVGKTCAGKMGERPISRHVAAGRHSHGFARLWPGSLRRAANPTPALKEGAVRLSYLVGDPARLGRNNGCVRRAHADPLGNPSSLSRLRKVAAPSKIWPHSPLGTHARGCMSLLPPEPIASGRSPRKSFDP